MRARFRQSIPGEKEERVWELCDEIEEDEYANDSEKGMSICCSDVGAVS